MAARSKKATTAPTVEDENDPEVMTWAELKKIGRPSLLTPELVENVCRYIMVGNYTVTACIICGISRDVYDLWSERAQEDLSKGKTEAESEFVNFLVSTEKARHYAEHRLVERLQAAPSGLWQKFAWMLERTRHAKFGYKQQVDITQDVTVTALSLPVAAPEFSSWLSQVVASERVAGRLHNVVSIDDAEVIEVRDEETLERVTLT